MQDERQVHGVVERAVQLVAGVHHSLYQLTLVSTVRTLAHCREVKSGDPPLPFLRRLADNATRLLSPVL